MNDKIQIEKQNAEKICDEKLKENAEKVKSRKTKRFKLNFLFHLSDKTSRRKMCTI